MQMSQEQARHLKRFKNINDATHYTAVNMGIVEPVEVATLMLLARHKDLNKPVVIKNYSVDEEQCPIERFNKWDLNLDFVRKLARKAPIKEHSIDINQSRFERLMKANTEDEFIQYFGDCLKVIDYDCSKQSIADLVGIFFNREEFPKYGLDKWYIKPSLEFNKHQKKERV